MVRGRGAESCEVGAGRTIWTFEAEISSSRGWRGGGLSLGPKGGVGVLVGRGLVKGRKCSVGLLVDTLRGCCCERRGRGRGRG